MIRLGDEDPRVLRRIKNLLETDQPIYVRILREGSRCGSIARAVGVTVAKTRSFYNASSHERIQSGFRLEWDDRKTTLEWTHNPYYLEWLPDATATEWVFTTEKREKVIAKPIYDRMGVEVQVGDLVTIAASQYELYVGKITRRSDKGTLWITSSPLSETDKGGLEIRSNPQGDVYRNLLKMDKGLFDRLVLAKLAS